MSKEFQSDIIAFKGKVEDTSEFMAYSRMIDEYAVEKEISCRLYNKQDELLLMFHKKPNESCHLTYAFGKGLEQKNLKDKEKISINRINLWNRVEAILNSKEAKIEAYQELPKTDLEMTVLGNFNYQGLLLNSSKNLDEKIRDNKIIEKTETEKGDIKPERKFYGYARTVDHVISYLTLAQELFGPPRYSRAGLVFSCEGKLPFYLILEKIDSSLFLRSAYFRTKVDMSEEAISKGSEDYIFERLRARFSKTSGRPTRIEGYNNPPKIGETNLLFANPMAITAFKMSLVRRLTEETRIDLDDSDSIPEDQDTRTKPKEKEHQKIDFEGDVEKDVETRFEDLFGEK